MSSLLQAVVALQGTPVGTHRALKDPFLRLVGALTVGAKDGIRNACQEYVREADNALYSARGGFHDVKPRRLLLQVSLSLEDLARAFNLEANYEVTAEAMEKALLEFNTPYPEDPEA